MHWPHSPRMDHFRVRTCAPECNEMNGSLLATRQPPVMEAPVAGVAGSGFIALVLVLGGFGVVLAGVNSTVFELERHGIPKALVLHATALLCLASLLPRWRRAAPGILELLLIGVVLWSALSSLFAANRWLALEALGVTTSGVVVFFGARHVAASERARRFTLGGLAMAATVAALLGAGQAYGIQLDWLAEERAPGGTFGNRNFLAHFLAIAIPLLLLAALRAHKRRVVIPATLSIALVAGTIVLTRSRAAWLAVIAAVVVMLFALPFARRAHPRVIRPRRALRVAVTLALGAVLAILVPNRLDWRSPAPYSETLARIADYQSGSGQGRLIQWENTLGLFREAPLLGVGPGNWFVHYPRVTAPGDPSFAGADPIPTNPWPSSDWVATLSERGLPGMLLMFFAGVTATLIALRRALVREAPPAFIDFDPGEARAARALAALGVIAAALVAGLFDAVLLLPAPTLLVWSLLGLLLPRTRPLLDRPLRPRERRLAISCVLLFFVALNVVTAGRMASLLVAREAPTRAQLELAARLDPGGHRVRLLLARRGPCRVRIPHARAAASLMPHHDSPERALRACGVTPDR